MSSNNEFGKYLQKMRKRHSPPLSQEDIGKLIGRDKMTISLIENGKNDPPQENCSIELLKHLTLMKKRKLSCLTMQQNLVEQFLLIYWSILTRTLKCGMQSAGQSKEFN